MEEISNTINIGKIRKIHHCIYKAYKRDPLYSKVPERYIKKNTKYCLKWADKTLVAIDWPDYLPKGEYEYFHMRCIPNR